jgi:hypothetical protein
VPDFNIIKIIMRAVGSNKLKDDFDGVTKKMKVMKHEMDGLKGKPVAPGTKTELDKLGKAYDDLGKRRKAMEAKLDKGFDPKAVQAYNRELQGLASISPVLGGIVGKLGLVYAGFVALKSVVRLFNAALKATADQEQAINRLGIAFQSMGAFTAAASRDMQGFADELKRTSRFSDQAVLSAAALIAQLGRLQGQALKDATQGAVDLAVGLGRDLSTAALIVAKAAQGSTFELRKYGLVIDRNIPKAERFARVMEFLSSKFGGVAEAEVRTASASFSQLRNAITDVGEAAAAPLLAPLVKQMQKARDAAFELAEKLKGLPGADDFFNPPEQDIVKALENYHSALNKVNEEARVTLSLRNPFDPYKGLREVSADAEAMADALGDIGKAANEAALKGPLGNIEGILTKLKAEVKALDDQWRQAGFVKGGLGATLPAELTQMLTILHNFQENFKLRLTVDTTGALGGMEDLLKAIEVMPKTVEVQIGRRGDVKEARELANAILSVPKNWKLLDDQWVAGIQDGNSEWAKMLATLPKIRAEIKEALDSGDMEKLEKVANKVAGAIKKFAAGSTVEAPNIPNIAMLQVLLEMADELDRSLPIAAKGIIDNAAIVQLDKLSDGIRAATRGDAGIVELKVDSEPSETLADALVRVREEAEALKSVSKISIAQTQYENVLTQLANLEKQYPETADQIRNFRNELATKFGGDFLDIKKADEARRALDVVRGAADQLRNSLDMPTTSLFDSQGITATTTDMNVLSKEFAKLADTAVELGETSALEGLFVKSSEELRRLAAMAALAGQTIDEELVESWKEVQIVARNGLTALQGLGKLDRLEAEMDFAVNVGDLDRAIEKFGQMDRAYQQLQGRVGEELQFNLDADMLAAADAIATASTDMDQFSPRIAAVQAELATMYALMANAQAGTTGHFALSVKIEGSEKALKQLKRLQAQAKSFEGQFEALGQSLLEQGIQAPFQAALADAENLEEQMVAIFKSMVSQIIAELAKLLAWQIITGIVSGGSTTLAQIGAGGFLKGQGPEKGSGDGNSGKPSFPDLPALPLDRTGGDLLAFSRSITPQQAVAARRESTDRFDPSTLIPLFPERQTQELHVHTPDIAGMVQAFRTGELGRAAAQATPRVRRTI